MGLRNGILIRIRKKHIRIGNKFDCVEGVTLQVNRFRGSVLLIVQYKYLKSCSGDFYSPESDPPHKIMQYWLYYSICWFFPFSLTESVSDRLELFVWRCTSKKIVSRRVRTLIIFTLFIGEGGLQWAPFTLGDSGRFATGYVECFYCLFP